MRVLERQNVYDPDLLIYRTALTMVRSASLNCYIFDVSTFILVNAWVCQPSSCHLPYAANTPEYTRARAHIDADDRQAEKSDTIETRMSLLQRQLGIGDACTFRLIEKNVTSLLPKSREQLKEDAKMSLSDLLR